MRWTFVQFVVGNMTQFRNLIRKMLEDPTGLACALPKTALGELGHTMRRR